MELKDLKLPLSVVSSVDVTRLVREMVMLNDFFVSATNRAPGTPVTPPRISRSLNEVAHDNHLNLLEEKDRQVLGALLDQILKKSPLLHISFAAEPQPKFTDQILTWMRANVHPQALMQVGLQPTMAAGCVLRTSNKVFDMSLRSYLKQEEPFLVRLIAGANHEA